MSQAANYISVPAVAYVIPIVPMSVVYYPVVVQYHRYTPDAAITSKGPSGAQQSNEILGKTENPWNKLLEKPKKQSPWDTLMSKEKAGVVKTEEKKSRSSTGHCSFTIGPVICRGCHRFYCTANCHDCEC
ncbi:hypothetical protein EV426DRAFT_702577 [Tirmania nivea]|nr:hypothetical protein EV426DRAFT_702577 [Tirmania nivea]